MREIRILMAVFLGILLLLFFQSMIHLTLLQRRVLLLHERLERLERIMSMRNSYLFELDFEFDSGR